MKTEGKRILIINVNWIGDVLFSTAFIRAIRKANPAIFISCMIPPRCYEVLELNPNLNEVITYDERGGQASIFAKAKFILELKRKRFDTAILLHRSFTRCLLAYLSGIKKRVGYYTKKRASFLTKAVEPPAGELHRVDYFLNIAKEMGIAGYTKEYEFFIKEKDKDYIKNVLQEENIVESDSVVVINPGGNWKPKRWPKENFAKVSQRLINEFNAKIVISGAEKDRVLAEEISLLANRQIVNLCGKTNLKQLAALLERADLVISGDTGPAHIAAAMGSAVIALFGPTSPKITGPYGRGKVSIIWKVKECEVPCYDLSCADNKCMKLIAVEDVIAEARKIL